MSPVALEARKGWANPDIGQQDDEVDSASPNSPPAFPAEAMTRLRYREEPGSLRATRCYKAAGKDPVSAERHEDAAPRTGTRVDGGESQIGYGVSHSVLARLRRDG